MDAGQLVTMRDHDEQTDARPATDTRPADAEHEPYRCSLGHVLAEGSYEWLQMDNERLRHENGVLRAMLVEGNPCIHEKILRAREDFAAGRTTTFEELDAALAQAEQLAAQPKPTQQEYGARWVGRTGRPARSGSGQCIRLWSTGREDRH